MVIILFFSLFFFFLFYEGWAIKRLPPFAGKKPVTANQILVTLAGDTQKLKDDQNLAKFVGGGGINVAYPDYDDLSNDDANSDDESDEDLLIIFS